MRKRLRKKRRLGEFREDCFELNFRIDPALNAEAHDAVIDELIEMIADNELQFGGGGGPDWSGIVQGPFRGTANEADREFVLAWLRSHPHVVKATAGPLRDGWYGWQ